MSRHIATSARSLLKEETMEPIIWCEHVKRLCALVLSSMPFGALAAVNEAVANAPAEQVDMVYVVIFGVLFIGMIVGFFIWMWWADRNKKKAD